MTQKDPYVAYETEDFLRDEHFQNGVLGTSPEAEAFWKKWLQAHPEKREAAARAAEFIRRLRFETDYLTPEEIEDSLARQLRLIADLDAASRKPRSRLVAFRRAAAWSGAAIVAAAVGWALFRYHPFGPRMHRLETAAGIIRSVTLPDSTVVTVNARSSLRWPADFGKNGKREVWVEGEAFFNVRHEGMPAGAAPFIVHATHLDIAVLGTQFNVKSGLGFTNVILNKGRIRIRLEDSASRALEPGEMLRYTESDHRVAIRRVIPELYTSWKDRKMTLDKMPMSELAGMIRDVYGDSAVFSDPRLASCRISGTLQVSDEKSLIETLAFVLDIDIVRRGHVLLFTTK